MNRISEKAHIFFRKSLTSNGYNSVSSSGTPFKVMVRLTW